MNCSEVESLIDDYLETLPGEGLDDAQAAALALHVQSCPACASELEKRQLLRQRLKATSVPGPDSGFLSRAVAQAAEQAELAAPPAATEPSMKGRRRPRIGQALTALAATLVAALLIGSVLTTPVDPAPETTLQSIQLATDTVTPVKLAFSAETALEDARLTLSLPVGVELMGYDGQTDLSWNTHLEEGTNVLRLPLIGRMAASDVLIARLEHPSGAKTFRLPVTVNE